MCSFTVAQSPIVQSNAIFTFIYDGPSTIYVDSNCVAPLEWGHPDNPRVIYDGPPGGFLVGFNLQSISGGYDIGDPVPGGESVSITYRAHDNMGNDANFTFQITFADSSEPIWNTGNLPADVTINCLDELNVGNPTATDNCTDSNNIVYNHMLVDPVDECEGGSFPIRYFAEDESGNIAEYEQEITVVKDETPPVITAFPTDDTAFCENLSMKFQAWVDQQIMQMQATDNSCDSVSFSVDSTAMQEVLMNCGPYEVDFYAGDQCGNRSTVTAVFTIIDTMAPQMIGPAEDASANCDMPGNISHFQDWLDNHGGMEVSDNCVISWSTIPDQIQIRDVCNDSIEVTFVATDQCGASVQSQATFQLTDTTAPVINTPPSNLITACGNQDYLTVAENWLLNMGNADIEDYCSADSNLVVSYELNGNVVDLQTVLDSFENDAFEGCTDNVMIGGSTFDNVLAALNITFIVQDPCGNEVRTDDSWIALIDLQSPVITENASDTTVNCQSQDSLEQALYRWYDNNGGLRATDDCATVIYTANVERDSLWQQLQDSMEVHCGNTGSVDVEFYANDLCGNQTQNPQVVTFSIIDTIAPQVQSPMNILKNCRPGSRDSIIVWLDELAFAEIEEYCGSFTVDSFTWTTNTGQSGTGQPNAGPYPDISQIGCNYRLDVEFHLQDECGNNTSYAVFYRLFDMLPPTFNNVQDTVTVDCGSDNVLDSTQITDNCVIEPVINYSDDTIRSGDTSDCSYYNYTIQRSYTAEDACGNSAEFMQTLFIIDTMAPEYSVPGDILVQCDEIDSLSITGSPGMISDACESRAEMNYLDSIMGSGCTYEVLRTWTAEDVCGNARSKTQVITVSDTIDPVVIEEAKDLTLQCSTSSNPDSVFQLWLDSLSAAFMDNCSFEGTFKAISTSYEIGDTSTWPGLLPDSIDYADCANYASDTIYAVAIDIVGYDACNNAGVSRAHFTLIDDSAPEIDCHGDIEIATDPGECHATFHLPVLDVSDPCSKDQFSVRYQIEGVDTFSSLRPDTFQYSLEKGTYAVNVDATDCAGNSSNCSFNILVIDTEPPQITCSGDTSYFIDSIGCEREVVLDVPMATSDNCELPDTIEYSFYVDGATDISSTSYRQYDPSPLVLLNGGYNDIHFVATDESGNRDTCSYTIIVEDTIAPNALCRPATVFANPSGVVYTIIDPELINGGSTDNCKVDSFWTRPQSVRCQQVGQQLDIVLFAFDEFGNVDSCQTVIRVESEVLEPSYELDICDPDTLFLFANAPPPNNVYTFEWTGPNGFTSNQRNPIIPNAGSQNSGTYQLTITGFDNCMAEGSVSVNISDIATPDLTADNFVNCEGNEIRLISNTFSEDVTYHWYEGIPPGGTLLASTSEPVFDVNPTPGSHDYYVIVEAENCTSNPSVPVEIEIISQPVAQVDTTYIEVCEGETIELEAIDQGPGYDYIWTGPDGYYSTLPSPPSIMNASQVHEGRYRLVVVAGDCSSSPVFVEVVVNELPPPVEVSVEDVYCEGESLIFTATSPLNSDVYYWTSPNGDEYSSQGPVFDFGPVSSAEAGIWLVNSEKNACRTSGNTEVLVNVEVLPEVEITINGSLCEGDSIELTATAYPGASYSWSGPGLSENGRTVRFIPSSGSYSVTLTSDNDCETTASRIINVIEPPTITALSNSGMECIPPGTDIRLVPTVFPQDSGGRYSYVWSGPNNFSSSDSIGIIENAGQEDNGFYVLRVIDRGCASDPDSTEISVTRIPDKPEIEGIAEYCEGETIELNTGDPGAGDQSFEWITPAGDTVTETPVLIVPAATKSDSGYYRLSTVVNGCESPLSDSFLVNIKTVPQRPVISGTSQLCEGDTIVLAPTNLQDVSYKWVFPNGRQVDGDTVIIYNADSSDQGSYQLRALKNGCASSYSTDFNVQVSPIPEIPAIEDIDEGICLLDENASIEACIENSTATSGAVYYWYNAENGDLIAGPSGALCAGIDTLSGFKDGTNSIIVQAELNGCFSTTSIPENITMSLPETTEANGGNDLAICSDEAAVLNATPPPSGSGEWSVVDGSAILSDPNIPNPQVSNLEVGENLFVWSLSYGFCENYATDTVTVLFDEAPFPENDEYVTAYNTRLTMDVLDNDDIVGPVRITIVNGPKYGTAQISGNNIVYFPANTYIGNDSLEYQICSVNCPELCESATVSIQVGDESLCDIPTIFTPNGDGVNDVFIIQCLSSNDFPGNRVVIFNQYGDEVFYASPYENNWQGTYKGDPLPAGTYFYVVDFGTGRIEKGFVVIER